jgi:hypothetical protein
MGGVWYGHPITPEAVASHASRLVGQRLQAIERFEFDEWIIRFSGGSTVQTGSAWRLIDRERVEVTSEDHGHPFGLPEPVDATVRVMASTRGREVTAVSIGARTGDLLIDFGKDVQVQLLQMSCGYEAWRLSGGGTELVCGGGGEIVQLREEAPPGG